MNWLVELVKADHAGNTMMVLLLIVVALCVCAVRIVAHISDAWTRRAEAKYCRSYTLDGEEKEEQEDDAQTN